MNKSINEEEIARLMRVTSEPLRRNWEKVMKIGRLEDVIASRETAIAKQKASKTNSSVTLLALLPLLILTWGGMFMTIIEGRASFTLKFSLMVLATIVVLLANFWTLWFWSERSNKMWHKIDECEKILTKFQTSVDSLNPLGIGNSYHDVLTAAVVIDRTVDLAYRVVDAEDRFERLLKPGAIRFDVVHAGQWIEKCSDSFDRIWTAANNDFALELNKRDIFARAAAHFSEREKRQPAHLAK